MKTFIILPFISNGNIKTTLYEVSEKIRDLPDIENLHYVSKEDKIKSHIRYYWNKTKFITGDIDEGDNGIRFCNKVVFLRRSRWDPLGTDHLKRIPIRATGIDVFEAESVSQAKLFYEAKYRGKEIRSFKESGFSNPLFLDFYEK